MKASRMWIFVALGYGLLVMGFRVVSSLSLSELQTVLQEKTPSFLYANLTLILFALLLEVDSFPRWRKRLAAVKGRLLLLLVAAGLVLTTVVAPATHRIYFDEDIYQGIAMNMVYTNRAQMCNEGTVEYGVFQCQRGEYNKQPNGFPFLLATVFQLTGVHEQAAFYFNNFLLGVAMVVVFLIAYHLFHSLRAGYFAALITALTPQNLHWFNTTAAEPAAAVSSSLVVLAGLHVVRKKTDASFLLLAGIAAFGLHMRPENGLILLVLPLIFLLYWPRVFLEPRFHFSVWFFAVIAAPLMMHALVVRQNPWGSNSVPFSTSYFFNNLATNFSYYFSNIHYPVLFTCLALVGWFHWASWRQQTLLWIWFILFWGVFLFFYAGSYSYGADIRFSVPSHLPLALLAGGAAQQTCRRFAAWSHRPARQWYRILTLFLFLAFIPFLPKVRALTYEAWAARADHRFVLEMVAKLPEESIVLTHNPGMFHLLGKNAAQASIALEDSGKTLDYFFNRYRGGVYFHFNFWCNVSDPLQNSFCAEILQRNPHEKVVEYREQNYRYALYRLVLPEKK